MIEKGANDEQIDTAIDEINITDIHKKDKLKKLINNFRDIFDENPGRFKSYQHQLYLSNNEPFFVKNYPIPTKYQDSVAKDLKASTLVRL